MGDSGKQVRKTRKDKKKEVKATLSIELKDSIYQMSRITRTPVKNVCEILCNMLSTDRKTISNLSRNFQHDLFIDDTLYKGYLDNVPINKRIAGRTETVKMKFNVQDYDAIYRLAFALGASPSRTVAVLLQLAMRDIDVVNQYIKDYLTDALYPSQYEDLKQLLKYINRHNDNHQSWASFLAYIVNNTGNSVMRMSEVVGEFLNKK